MTPADKDYLKSGVLVRFRYHLNDGELHNDLGVVIGPSPYLSEHVHVYFSNKVLSIWHGNLARVDDQT